MEAVVVVVDPYCQELMESDEMRLKEIQPVDAASCFWWVSHV